MSVKQMLTTCALVVMLVATASISLAQDTSQRASGWAGRAMSATSAERSTRVSTEESREARLSEDSEFQAAANATFPDVLERFKENRRRALIGAWRVHIPISASGLPAFNAYHSFHEGGTFTEFSDLLGALNESPSAGVWDLDEYRYVLTFELFAFDQAKKPAGVVRVRCTLDVTNDDLKGDAVVDFIEPNGNEILEIDRTPFTGKRVRKMFP